MRSFFLTLGLVMCSGLLHSAETSSTTPAPFAPKRVVTACGHHDYPPWNWRLYSQIVGACADVVRDYFTSRGYEVNLQYVGPWKRCQYAVERGHVDVNICAFRNPERERYSTFVPTPMGHNEYAVFTRVDATFPFSQWEDLAGKRIAIVRGVSVGQEFDTFLRQRTALLEVGTTSQAFELLALKRVDAVTIARQSGRAVLEHISYDRLITDLPHPILKGTLYISISNKSSDLLPLVDDLAKWLSRPEYAGYLQERLEAGIRTYARSPVPND